MQNIEELYILGESGETIETPIGQLHFIKVKDYAKLMQYVPLLYLDKKDLLMSIKDEYKDLFKDMQFIDIIKYFDSKEYPLYQQYKKLFILCFKEDVFDLIKSDEEFDEYRQMIIKMNCINYEKPNPNPEIEYFNKLERMMRERNGEVITLKSIITSVGLYHQNPFELTIYYLYALFDRIANFKNYDTTTLYKTVDVENKIQINSWYKDNTTKTELNDKDNELINNNLNKIQNNTIKN